MENVQGLVLKATIDSISSFLNKAKLIYETCACDKETAAIHVFADVFQSILDKAKTDREIGSRYILFFYHQRENFQQLLSAMLKNDLDLDDSKEKELDESLDIIFHIDNPKARELVMEMLESEMKMLNKTIAEQMEKCRTEAVTRVNNLMQMTEVQDRISSTQSSTP